MHAGKEHNMDCYCFRDTCNKTTIRNDKYFRNHWKSKHQMLRGWDYYKL